MSDDPERERILSDDSKWWEFMDPETYEVREDLPAATFASADRLDWTHKRALARKRPVGFGYFNRCGECGDSVPPDFTFCVHCGGEPRGMEAPAPFTVVVSELEDEEARSAFVELLVAAGRTLEMQEVERAADQLPVVFNVTARKDQVAALVARLAELGVMARSFRVDDPSIPWIQEAVESIGRSPRKLGLFAAVLVATVALTIWASLAFSLLGIGVLALLGWRELTSYKERFHLDVATLLQLVSGFDPSTAALAAQTLSLMSDKQAREHVTVCLMEYYGLTRTLRIHGPVYGRMLESSKEALEELMAEVMKLAHRYAKLDRFVSGQNPEELRQRLEQLSDSVVEDDVASQLQTRERSHLERQLADIERLGAMRTGFRERLETTARSMEALRERLASLSVAPTEEEWYQMEIEEQMERLEQELEVFQETFEAVEA